MNCNCQKDIEAKLTERFKAQTPKGTDHSTELQGYGFSMSGNAIKVCAFMSAKQTAMLPLKSGVMKQKTTSLSMSFNYCPFCGVKA